MKQARRNIIRTPSPACTPARHLSYQREQEGQKKKDLHITSTRNGDGLTHAFTTGVKVAISGFFSQSVKIFCSSQPLASSQSFTSRCRMTVASSRRISCHARFCKKRASQPEVQREKGEKKGGFSSTRTGRQQNRKNFFLKKRMENIPCPDNS